MVERATLPRLPFSARVRALLVVMLLSSFWAASCSTSKGQTTATPPKEKAAASVTPEIPPVNIASIIAREGFEVEGDPDLHGVGERWVDGVRWAKFDVTGRPTLLLQVWDYVGEGGWSWELHAFDVTDHENPRPVRTRSDKSEAILSGGGYMDQGYLRVLDLDGDGKDEIIDVGQTDGYSTSTLGLWFWNDAKKQLEDRIWAMSGGVDYVFVDLDNDLVKEVVAFGREHGDGTDNDGLEVRVLRRERGYWREVEEVGADWIERAAVHALTRPHERPDHVYPMAIEALEGKKLSDEQLDKIQKSLETQYASFPAERSWMRGAVVLAMGLEGNEAGARFLLSLSQSPEGAELRERICLALYNTRTKEGVAHAFEMFDRSLELAAQDNTSDGVIRALLIAAAKNNDPNAVQHFERAYESIGADERGRLLKTFYSAPATLAKPLSERFDVATDPEEIASLAYFFASRTRPYSVEHEVWLESLNTARLEQLSKHPSPQIRKQALFLFADKAPDRARVSYIEALADETDPTIIVMLLDNFPAQAIPEQQAPLTTSLKKVHTRWVSNREISYMLQKVIARQKNPALTALGLTWVRYPDSAIVHAPHGSTCDEKNRDALVDIFLNAIAASADEHVRRSYYEVLGRCGNKRAVDVLKQALEDETNSYVKATAVTSLGQLGASDVIPQLEAILSGSDDDVHLAEVAVEALVKFNTEEARLALRRSVRAPENTSDEQMWMQRVYLRALGVMIGVDAFEALLAERREKWALSMTVGCQNIMREMGVLGEVSPMRGSKALLRFVEEDKCQGKEEQHLLSVFDEWVRHPHKQHPEALALWFESPISRSVRVESRKAHDYIKNSLEMKRAR